MKIICLIPTYNTPIKQLAECLQSILDQTRPPDRILILDDGSIDPIGYSNAVGLVQLRSNTSFIIDRSDLNTGTASTLNRGHLYATLTEYDWVMIHGASDISHPKRVEKQVAYLQSHPETDVLSTGLTAFKGSKHNQIFSFVHPERPIPGYRKGHDKYFIANHGTVIYRNSAVMKVGGYTEGYGRGQDVELWRRMHESGAVFRAIPDILYYWRR